MGYRLAAALGDTVAVPQLVFSHLCQTDGDTIRVGLYVLQTGVTDPRAIARALALPSMEAARRSLQYWAGAGLLTAERAAPAPQPAEAPKASLADLHDPRVAVLCEEAQTALGRALGRSELLRLVALYLEDGWPPDVILLCCAEVARCGGHTVAAVHRMLGQWRTEGVETGEDAERHLRREEQRAEFRARMAPLFGVEGDAFSRWERTALTRWQEEWHCTQELVEEALLRAGSHRTVRYVNGILRSWRSQGITTAQAARGQGQLTGANLLQTESTPAAAAAVSPTGTPDLFRQDWGKLFDEED